MLHCAFVRSQHPSARIRSINVNSGLAVEGVVAVLTFADLQRWLMPLPSFGAIPPMLGERVVIAVNRPHSSRWSKTSRVTLASVWRSW